MTARHTWVQEGVAAGQIAIAKTAGETERFAAAELAKYIRKISGAAMPVVEGAGQRRRPSILILDAARPSNRKVLAGTPADRLRHDGFLIHTSGRDLVIAAREPSGVLFGVYQYLALVLGCRFYDFGPEGEDMPYSDTIQHESVAILKNPRLVYRGLQEVNDLRRLDWMAKNGFNYVRVSPTTMALWDEQSGPWVAAVKKRGLRIAYAHHMFQSLLPREVYTDEHPEYFLRNPDGSVRHRPQFSWRLSSREALQEVLYGLEQFLSRHPEIDMFDLWPDDGFAPLDEQEYLEFTGRKLEKGDWEKTCHGHVPTGRRGDPNKARAYALLAKQVADALAPKFPKLVISILNYCDLVQPCPDVTLPPNVAPVPTIYWRCIKHPLFDERCVYNSQFKASLLEWTALYPGRLIFLYEYYMGMNAHAALPYPCLTSLFAEWEWLVKIGIGGAHIQSLDTHAASYNINYLAFAALAWEDPPTLRQFLKEYCTGFFGEAGEAAYRVYMLWEQGCRRAPEDTQPGLGFFCLLGPEAQWRQCRTILNRAIGAAHDPKVISRLARLMILVEYAVQVSAIARPYHRLALAMRRGEETTTIERQLLPVLPALDRFARRLAEAGQDILSRSVPMDIVPPRRRDEDRPNPFARTLNQLLKKPQARREFNPDIAEAELARKGRRRRKAARRTGRTAGPVGRPAKQA